MHLMLDLETLSTAGDAAIIQIGIVPFEVSGEGMAGDGLNINVDPDACMMAGLRVDWSTVHWWMNQSAEARATLPAPGAAPKLSDALRQVIDFCAPLGSRNLKVWSNGSAFDVPIIENAFRRCRLDPPWQYYNVLDVRTMKMLSPDTPRREPEVAHNALSDSIAQALWVQDMYRDIKGRGLSPN
jgi:DNA polymerase III epsilon subunit-like protein